MWRARVPMSETRHAKVRAPPHQPPTTRHSELCPRERQQRTDVVIVSGAQGFDIALPCRAGIAQTLPSPRKPLTAKLDRQKIGHETGVAPVAIRKGVNLHQPVMETHRDFIVFFSGIRGVESLREEYEHPLRFLMSMVGLILLIACANVAMLLIARNASRQSEFGLRQALGAGRRVLFLQLLLESLALVTAGAALGWLFAGYATQALSAWSGIGILIAPDRTVLLFTLSISAAVALLFGLAPLRAVSRVPLNLALKSAERGRPPAT